MSVTPCYTILIEYKKGWAMDSDILINNLITQLVLRVCPLRVAHMLQVVGFIHQLHCQ